MAGDRAGGRARTAAAFHRRARLLRGDPRRERRAGQLPAAPPLLPKPGRRGAVMIIDPNPAAGVPQSYGRSDLLPQRGGPANLADILERVLDKGIVIAGDIQVSLLDIELLTIKIRLLVASVDRAREMGINWWEADPKLTGRANGGGELEQRLKRLERAAGIDKGKRG